MMAQNNGVTSGMDAGGGWLADLLHALPGCLLAGALLSGCAVIDKFPVSPKTVPVEEPRAQKPSPPPVKQPRVTILVSDDLPAYTGIAEALKAQLPQSPHVVELQGEQPSAAQFVDRLGRPEAGPVVAIGPLAARVASTYSAGRIVFCQVFNHQDPALAAPRIQGVAMLPPAELQFRAWKKLDPGLHRVGVITGPDHEDLIARAREAAQRQGIVLEHRVVHSDKEMLFAFKRLTPDIQGLWLLPDDRVLSRRVLRELMAYSSKHQRQVVVFHPELLRLGGLMSVGSVDADVAARVIDALHNASGRGGAPAAGLLPLSEIRVEVNSGVAQGQPFRTSLETRAAADAP